MIEIGESVMVSDPCHTPGTWCQGMIYDMLPGEYYTDGMFNYCWGARVSKIWIIHKDYLNSLYDIQFCAVPSGIVVGVDSGQAGIYDVGYYLSQWESNEKKESWYNEVCDLTYTQQGFTFNTKDYKCLVSSAGMGDGDYTCRIFKNENDKVVYVELDFGLDDDDVDFNEEEE